MAGKSQVPSTCLTIQIAIFYRIHLLFFVYIYIYNYCSINTSGVLPSVTFLCFFLFLYFFLSVCLAIYSHQQRTVLTILIHQRCINYLFVRPKLPALYVWHSFGRWSRCARVNSIKVNKILPHYLQTVFFYPICVLFRVSFILQTATWVQDECKGVFRVVQASLYKFSNFIFEPSLSDKRMAITVV